MSSVDFADCWFLVGPTASGKSAAALDLAAELGAEIVALDSMTLYRGMDIGTAKPTAADRRRVPHHLLDVLDPSESATVHWYREQALAACRDIAQRGHRPLLVGGTPLYLKACLRGLFAGPGADAALRAELEGEAERVGAPALHARLGEVDPAAAARILPNDLRRIVRALEVHRLTGRPISEWQQQFDRPADPPPKVACVTWPRDQLVRRIHDRIDAMLAAGWIDEARALFESQPPPGREASQAVGYAELRMVLAGELSMPAAIERIRQRTRTFSRKQMTWFRHIEEVRFVPTDADEPAGRLVARLRAFFLGP